MKKIMILAAVAAFSASCSDDDNGTPVAAGTNGTWVLTALTSSEAHDGNGDGNATTDLLTEAGCFGDSNLILAADGSLTNNFVIPGMDGCEALTANGTYVQTGSTVATTFSYGGETTNQDFTISGNTMIANVPDFFEIELEVNGEVTYQSVDATMVYTRQ